MDTYQEGDGWGALADGTRRAILARLAEGELPVGELAAGLPVTRSAVSQHLKVLKDAGLVRERSAGTRRIYRLNPEAVAALRDQLDTYWQRALAGYAEVAAGLPGDPAARSARETPAEQPRSEQSRPGQSPPGQSPPEQSRPEQSRPGQSPPGQSRPEER